MKITVLEMRAHIERLVEEHGITVRHVKRIRQSKCLPWDGAPPVMQFPPVRSVLTYVVALHELGHYLGGHVNHPDTSVRELAAWKWVRANAVTWTPAMERLATTYERREDIEFEKWERWLEELNRWPPE
jgi:hypothetical protein